MTRDGRELEFRRGSCSSQGNSSTHGVTNLVDSLHGDNANEDDSNIGDDNTVYMIYDFKIKTDNPIPIKHKSNFCCCQGSTSCSILPSQMGEHGVRRYWNRPGHISSLVVFTMPVGKTIKSSRLKHTCLENLILGQVRVGEHQAKCGALVGVFVFVRDIRSELYLYILYLYF